MDSKNYAEVLIDGEIYTLEGQEEEAYLQKVASYINEKISLMKKQKGFTKQNRDYQVTMVELNIADDYFKSQERVQKLEEQNRALEKEAPTHLRTAILGGEALQAKHLNRWRRALPQVRYINLYGPTEVTVDCTWYPIDREFADTEMVPIGRACANKEVFLLDGEGKPVPPGQPGEICVRGMGLAKGYYGQWDKTRESFVQDPRNPWYPDLIYRTGDLAVMDETGLLTFLSRADGQIKHMGYRIELGEIEATLSGIPSIREVACLFDRERDKILCIYTGGEETGEVAKVARAMLPRYMVPNVYHRREEMPHNPNGKIHRVQLKEEYLHEDSQPV